MLRGLKSASWKQKQWEKPKLLLLCSSCSSPRAWLATIRALRFVYQCVKRKYPSFCAGWSVMWAVHSVKTFLTMIALLTVSNPHAFILIQVSGTWRIIFSLYMNFVFFNLVAYCQYLSVIHGRWGRHKSLCSNLWW